MSAKVHGCRNAGKHWRSFDKLIPQHLVLLSVLCGESAFTASTETALSFEI
jgi:hypothetical protein